MSKQHHLNDATFHPNIQGGQGQFKPDVLADYDADYYSNGDDEPAELDADFIGKDYEDEDEYYDYDEYDSIVDRKFRTDSFSGNPIGNEQKFSKDYMNSGDHHGFTKLAKEDFSLLLEKISSNRRHVNDPSNNLLKRRHSFASADYEDYENNDSDENYDDYEGSAYDNSDYQETEGINYNENRPLGNHLITYDGRDKPYEDVTNKPMIEYTTLHSSGRDASHSMGRDTNYINQGKRKLIAKLMIFKLYNNKIS